MIKLGTQKLVRECLAVYEYTADNGELKTEEIVVRYFSHSVAQAREVAAKLRTIYEEAAARKEPVWLSQTLPFTVESLPGVVGLDGKPIVTAFDKNGFPTAKTITNFEAIPRHNLTAIEKAIQDDLSPKEQPST